jgi:hypothetical protein
VPPNPVPVSNAVEEVKNVISWANYAGTIQDAIIPFYATPYSLTATTGFSPGCLAPHAQAVADLLTFSFNGSIPIRPLGSAWSFSKVIQPGTVALDTLHLNFMDMVPAGMAPGAHAGTTPVYIGGGTLIGDVNRRLGTQFQLALQTSGAADGQRIAGALATGTHGAALQIGAVPETVVGLHLMVAPNRCVYLQSASQPACTDAFRQLLESATGIPTDTPADPDAFPAALVGLGSFGVVLGVVVEAVPLYQLQIERFETATDNPKLLQAIAAGDPTVLRGNPPGTNGPYHFDVVFNPYPPAGGGAFVTIAWKVSAAGVPFQSPSAGPSIVTSDLMSYVGPIMTHLGQINGGLTIDLIRLVEEQIIGQSGKFGVTGLKLFPGQMFGPTTLPKGSGISNELIFPAANAAAALSTVQSNIQLMAAQHKFLLGPIGLRFMKGPSTALLGMNQFAQCASIELPSVRTEDVKNIYRVIWAALHAQNIPFTCHWGQWHELTQTNVAGFFGAKATRWTAARKALLGNVGSAVFAAPMLSDVGL